MDKSGTLEAWSAKAYEHANRHGNFLGRRNYRAVLRFARSFLKAAVLDAGCGDGTTVRMLRKSFPQIKVFGVDLAPMPGAGISKASLTDMPFEDATFDCVLCMDVIEHIPMEECTSVLHEIRRVLKPKGHLCVTTPNEEDLEAALSLCPHCKKRFHPIGHTRSFSADQLRDQLSEGGFGNIRIRSYSVDAYYHFGMAAGIVSMIGRRVFPNMRWDEMLFAAAQA